MIDCSLYFSTICYVRLSKITAALSLPRRFRAYPSLARALLPDCECKGRAFLHSLQDFDEKKCEKISFAPILPSHSIAKSALKPIFSPLPHPIFFAPKSPFFPLFPVLDSISDTFSRNRARFLPCEAHFFLVFPRFGSDFGRFFEGSSLFSAPNFNFSLLLPVLPHASGTSSRDLTLYFLRSPLFAQREGFFISCSLILHALHHLHLPIYSPPVPHPPPSSLPPPLSFSFLPTFPPPSPINTRARAPSRNTRVRVRPHLLARQEVFVYCLHRFTTPRNPLCTNTLGVKKNEKKPSQNAQQPHNQEINTKHPISSAVNLISSPR